MKEENLHFDWLKLVDLPGADSNRSTQEGQQVLHFFTGDKDYRKSQSAKDFVAKYFRGAKALKSDAEALRYGSDHVTLEGMYLEMGVCTGRTINFIAALNPSKIVYGFDSFKGLPEAWERDDMKIPKGSFGFKEENIIPPVLNNVRLIKGMFNETLPEFKKKILKDSPIAFLHVDCDLYSSTNQVFSILADHIIPGTIVVFDELYNYPNSENHEFRAFQEFLNKTGRTARYLAYNELSEQAVVKIEG